MSAQTNTVVSLLVDRVFPRMPDFYGLVNEQCDLAVEAMEVFVEFMQSGDGDKALRVRELEKEGDTLKSRNTNVLNSAFATPMDREDIFRAISSVDHVINYAKTTVREFELLKLAPDKYALEIALQLKDGARALQCGYRKLSQHPALAESDAQAARKAERNAEKIYRRALATMFNTDNCLQIMKNKSECPEVDVMQCVLDIFKRREIYRHLSNAADRVARAGSILHDIVVKIS